MSSFILEPTEEYDEKLGKVVRRRPTPGDYLEHIPNVINTRLGNLIYGPRKEARCATSSWPGRRCIPIPHGARAAAQAGD